MTTPKEPRPVTNGKRDLAAAAITWRQLITLLSVMAALTGIVSWFHANMVVPTVIEAARREWREDIKRHSDLPTHTHAATKDDLARLERAQERLVGKMDQLIQTLLKQQK